MGLGKVRPDELVSYKQTNIQQTLQTIAFHAYLRERSPAPFLVVCPLSVLNNWADEFKKFAPEASLAPFRRIPVKTHVETRYLFAYTTAHAKNAPNCVVHKWSSLKRTAPSTGKASTLPRPLLHLLRKNHHPNLSPSPPPRRVVVGQRSTSPTSRRTTRHRRMTSLHTNGLRSQ